MMKYILPLLIFLASINQSQAQQTHTIYFDFNQVIVTSKAIDSLKVWMMQNTPKGVVIISGHTDSRGSSKYNQALSQRRAKAVAYTFRSLCSNCFFQIQSFGKTMPVSQNNQALNRRVEIIWTSAAQTIDTLQRITKNPLTNTIPSSGNLLKIPALQKIYFIPDKAIIEASSLPYVEELANILQHYPEKALFEIRGHVNAPGDKFDKLSEDRAKEIYLHLVDLGVPANSLRYRGMGTREMAFPSPKNEEEMRKNIRVDIMVFQ